MAYRNLKDLNGVDFLVWDHFVNISHEKEEIEDNSRTDINGNADKSNQDMIPSMIGNIDPNMMEPDCPEMDEKELHRRYGRDDSDDDTSDYSSSSTIDPSTIPTLPTFMCPAWNSLNQFTMPTKLPTIVFGANQPAVSDIDVEKDKHFKTSFNTFMDDAEAKMVEKARLILGFGQNEKQSNDFGLAHVSKEENRINLTNESDGCPLMDIIKDLPLYGTILYDESTRYWYIKLPAEWQDITTNIAECVYDTYHDSNWYKESEQHGRYWHESVHAADPIIAAPQNGNNEATVQCTHPPSIAGLHISLGVFDADSNDLPEALEIGKKVQFCVGDIISFRSTRPIPQNIAGQFTTEHKLRFYPTRWIFAEVEFVDFEYDTKYPPHLSMACVAVQLNIDCVARFEHKYEKSKTSSISSTSSEEECVMDEPLIFGMTDDLSVAASASSSIGGDY